MKESTSKTDLLIKINTLEAELREIAEKDITLMTPILEKEEATRNSIQILILQCEAETGRTLYIPFNLTKPNSKRKDSLRSVHASCYGTGQRERNCDEI